MPALKGKKWRYYNFQIKESISSFINWDWFQTTLCTLSHIIWYNLGYCYLNGYCPYFSLKKNQSHHLNIVQYFFYSCIFLEYMFIQLTRFTNGWFDKRKCLDYRVPINHMLNKNPLFHHVSMMNKILLGCSISPELRNVTLHSHKVCMMLDNITLYSSLLYMKLDITLNLS